jgi:hypothetical protein
MKMQLPPPNNFSIASKPPSYSAPQQRQGAFVERPLRDLVRDAQQKNPKLAPKLGAVLREITALRDGLKIDVDFIDSIETLTENGLGHLPDLINKIHFLRTHDREGNLLGICVLLANPLDAVTLLEGLWLNLAFLKSRLPKVHLQTE